MQDIEKNENKPIYKGKGGFRPNSGRKKGKLSAATLERIKVEEAFKQRILGHVDNLFNSQLALAQGLTHLFRIDETGEGKNKKREHVLVTDPQEIKDVLDETKGGSGVYDEHYYFITTKDPENKAIDSMFDRAFGKAAQSINLGNQDGEVLKISVVPYVEDKGSNDQAP